MQVVSWTQRCNRSGLNWRLVSYLMHKQFLKHLVQGKNVYECSWCRWINEGYYADWGRSECCVLQTRLFNLQTKEKKHWSLHLVRLERLHRCFSCEVWHEKWHHQALEPVTQVGWYWYLIWRIFFLQKTWGHSIKRTASEWVLSNQIRC